MKDFKVNLDRKIDYIIDQSDSLRQEPMTVTEGKINSLIMEVFSFAANALVNLNELVDVDEETRELVLKKILEHDKVIREHKRMSEHLK